MKLKKFENYEEFYEETDKDIVLEILVDTHEFDDVSYEYHDLIQKRFNFGEDYDFEQINNNNKTPLSDNYYMDIDKMINKLSDFKNKGAEFVSIDYNVDHSSYLLDAIKIEKK